MTFVSRLAVLSFEDKYAQSVNAADKYVSVIEATSPPTKDFQHPSLENLGNLIIHVKQVLIPWTNDVSPNCRALPSIIAHWDSELQIMLGELAELARQQQPFSDPIKQQIANSARSGLGIFAQDSEQVSSLSGGLKTLSADLQNTLQSLDNAQGQLGQIVASFHQDIANLFGMRHQLESAICPDNDRIRQVDQQINATQTQINAAWEWMGVLQQLRPSAADAMPAICFLASYWFGFAAELANAMRTLRQIQQLSDPILSLDLAQVQTSWNMIHQRMEQLAKTLV